MSKKVRVIYLYLVSFITLALIIIGIVGAINSFASYSFPSSYNYSNYNSLVNTKREFLRSGITYLALFAISLPLHIYNWKKIQSELAESLED